MRRRSSLLIAVVGRDSLRKDGLTQFLRSAGFGVVISLKSVDGLCARRLQQQQFLFLIVHGGHDFEAAVEQIGFVRNRHPDARVVVIGDRCRLRELTVAFRAGANGYFVDATTPDVFMKSIELVMMGETVYPAAFLPCALDPESESDNHASTCEGDDSISLTPDDRISPRLSPREKSILRRLVAGDSNKSIARKIEIAEGTVKVHIKAILRKLGVQNRTQAAMWGINNQSVAGRMQTESANLSSGSDKAARNVRALRDGVDTLPSAVITRLERPAPRDVDPPDSDRAAIVLNANGSFRKARRADPDQDLL
jgi:two-component system, NarL family, nitrate/nitrite response regulator NarL